MAEIIAGYQSYKIHGWGAVWNQCCSLCTCYGCHAPVCFFLLLVSADSWEAYGARKDPYIHILAEIHLLFLSRVQPAQQGSLSNRVRGSWCYRFGFLWVSGFFLICIKKCHWALHLLSLSPFLVLLVTTYRSRAVTKKKNKLRHALHCLHSTKQLCRCGWRVSGTEENKERQSGL